MAANALDGCSTFAKSCGRIHTSAAATAFIIQEYLRFRKRPIVSHNLGDPFSDDHEEQ